jgi:hypothetical protein
MNAMPKIVVSRTLDRAEWTNTQLINAAEDLATLKQEPGKQIAVLGGPNLTASLHADRLDRRTPHHGEPGRLRHRQVRVQQRQREIGLNLVKTRPLDSGKVLLYYEPGAANEQ